MRTWSGPDLAAPCGCLLLPGKPSKPHGWLDTVAFRKTHAWWVDSSHAEKHAKDPGKKLASPKRSPAQSHFSSPASAWMKTTADDNAQGEPVSELSTSSRLSLFSVVWVGLGINVSQHLAMGGIDGETCGRWGGGGSAWPRTAPPPPNTPQACHCFLSYSTTCSKWWTIWPTVLWSIRTFQM